MSSPLQSRFSIVNSHTETWLSEEAMLRTIMGRQEQWPVTLRLTSELSLIFKGHTLGLSPASRSGMVGLLVKSGSTSVLQPPWAGVDISLDALEMTQHFEKQSRIALNQLLETYSTRPSGGSGGGSPK